MPQLALLTFGLAGLHMDEEAFERSMNETLQQSKTPEGRAAIEARTKQLMEELEAQHEGDRTTQCQICLEPLDQTLALERQDAADDDPATSVETLCCGHIPRRLRTAGVRPTRCTLRSARWKAPPARRRSWRSCAEDACSERGVREGRHSAVGRDVPYLQRLAGQIADQLAMPVPTRATKATMPSWLGFSERCWLGRSSAGLCSSAASATRVAI